MVSQTRELNSIYVFQHVPFETSNFSIRFVPGGIEARLSVIAVGCGEPSLGCSGSLRARHAKVAGVSSRLILTIVKIRNVLPH